MTEETKGAEGEIAEELKRLGTQLHFTAKAAWESQERSGSVESALKVRS